MSFINIRNLTLEIGDHVIQLTIEQAEQLKDELNQLLPLPDLDTNLPELPKQTYTTNFEHPFFKNGHISDSTTSHT